MKLHIGQPTGHHGNYAGTLTTDDGAMLRGQMHPNRWRDFADVLRKGCTATGRTFDYVPHKETDE
jgi:hypothetical protein